MAPPMSLLGAFLVDFMKLEMFDGLNFLRWQNKLHFPIHYIECDLCSTTSKPKENKDELLVIFNAFQRYF